MLQRRRYLYLNYFIRINLLRQHVVWLQRLCREDGVIRLIAFLLPLLLLLPFLYLLGQFLLTLGIWCLCKHFKCIDLTDKVTQRISHHIVNLHTKRILVDQCGISQPIVDGILLYSRLNDESGVSIEVQPLDHWQIRMAISKEHRELLRILTFRLQQITVCLNMGESQQRDIIRQEVGIRCLFESINMQRVTPDCVYLHIRF